MGGHPPQTAPEASADLRPSSLGVVRRITYGKSGAILTPASGFIKAYKFTLNPYSGCGFACDYCYARFFTYTPDDRDSWGEWVHVKANAASLIERATTARQHHLRLEPSDAIYMSSVTDPYQPLEAKLGFTRSILESLLPMQPRLTVQTRSPIATRDIDLFQQFERIRVNYSVPTDSEEVRLRYEPHAPSIKARLKAAETIAAAGVPIGISISPMLPMADPAAFGQRIAALDAAEYVTQSFHRLPPYYGAGTGEAALVKAREDRWTRRRFLEAHDAIQAALGPGRPLLLGVEGYRPAERRR